MHKNHCRFRVAAMWRTGSPRGTRILARGQRLNRIASLTTMGSPFAGGEKRTRLR